MFDLYDIFDSNEINVVLLSILVVILISGIIGLIIYEYEMRKKLIKVETKLKDVSDALDMNINNNYISDIPDVPDVPDVPEITKSNNNNNNNNNINYKKKYEELLKEKDFKDPMSMQYSPSEYATLLKYNPILPYSAFTMDIINNAYLDMNEKGMYEDKYFALSNYDNIYNTSSNNSSNTSNTSNTSNNSNNTKQSDNPSTKVSSTNTNPVLPPQNNSTNTNNF